MKLKVIQNTTFKQLTEDSLSLSEQGNLLLKAGEIFSVHSWKPLDRNYLKVVLEPSFGKHTQITWFAYIPHVQLISDDGEVKAIPQSFPPETCLLKMPYNKQVDDVHYPTGACNITSLAMVMAYFRVKQTRNNIWLMEDEVYQHLIINKLDYWNPRDLAKMASNYGLKDDFTMRGYLSDIRQTVLQGHPCILHEHSTCFGNTVVIRGCDQNGFFVNDPYGRWTSSGYRDDLPGENVYYSNEFVQSKYSSAGDDFLWLHRLSKNNFV